MISGIVTVGCAAGCQPLTPRHFSAVNTGPAGAAFSFAFSPQHDFAAAAGLKQQHAARHISADLQPQP